ncbi:hypothetical protein JXA85_00605 [Candidatus Woesearchaeota archaeon]|nr:hypothetical protein [Candidatus Woesearchaeota archaeon]
MLFDTSNDIELKEKFNLGNEETSYGGAISHSCYAIFYSAKAMLLSKGITTDSPELYKKTFDAFKKTFIDTGLLDMELLLIYKELIVRAEVLLGICREEKKKRGNFTYNTIPRANRNLLKSQLRMQRRF